MKIKENEPVFGNIFQSFFESKSFTNNLLETKKELLSFLPDGALNNKKFLDAGCGVGLYSLVASEQGPDYVLSFDVDPKMVEFTLELKKNLGKHSNWKVEKGNILAEEYISTLGKFDYVYCWGVAHHTGNMWKALENIITAVEYQGYIYLGIYNNASAFGFWDDRRFGSSQFWRRVKLLLHKSPNFIRSATYGLAVSIYFIFSKLEVIFGRYRFKDFKQRGMNSSISIKDWLFGYPYEYASVDEVFYFMKERGFNLEKIESNIGLRTNHYLFKKVSH